MSMFSLLLILAVSSDSRQAPPSRKSEEMILNSLTEVSKTSHIPICRLSL